MNDDYRLAAARRLVWNVEAWREPSILALAIFGLQAFLVEFPDQSESHAEAENLIKKLHQAGKPPASRNTTAY
jgi:hypothetical protein